MDVADRFWARVDKTGDCWLWTGRKRATGYGEFDVAHKEWKAHRWAYEHLVAPVPAGLEIDHLCKNPGCVNPEHMEPVTPAENKRRMWFSRVYSLTCPKGHPRAGNWATWGKRQALYCKACKRVDG